MCFFGPKLATTQDFECKRKSSFINQLYTKLRFVLCIIVRPVKLSKFHSVTYIFMISSQRGVNKIRGLIGHFKQKLAQIWIKFFIRGCSKLPHLKKFSRKFQELVLGFVGLIYAKGNGVAQPIWSWDCPTEAQKQHKYTKNAFFACFWAYFRQPHDHIGWAAPFSFIY